MARIYGLNGLIRGRQGNNVFSIQNGTQVVKVYNPQVANPRTIAQREQRVKFAMAGKMSGATPSEALIGIIGGSNRSRRARFVQLITRRASVTGTEANLVAAIPYGNVTYSEGPVAMFSVTPQVTAVSSGTSPSNRINVTIAAMSLSTITPTGYGELAIAALYDNETSQLDEVQVQERSTTTAASFVFRQGRQRDCRVACYIVPFINEQRLARPNSDSLSDSESAITLTARSVYRLAGSNFGQSIFIGVYPVLASQTSMAPSDDMRDAVEEALTETAVAEGKKKK